MESNEHFNKSLIIDNKSGLKSVHDILELRDSKFPPTNCVIEALELCLSCNNSIFYNTNYLQTDGTAQGPHMFRDDMFAVWTHGSASVSLFLEYPNNIDKTGKIQFTMQAA